jgi:hypothetical protein
MVRKVSVRASVALGSEDEEGSVEMVGSIDIEG